MRIAASSERDYTQWGGAHPTLQRFDARAEDMGCDDDDSVDPTDVRTWFDNSSDDVAFHTPPVDGSSDGGKCAYPTLTYRQLGEQMDACNPWPAARARGGAASGNVAFFAVGILLPSEMMTELAVTHLCVMSGGGCSAPLDPRGSRAGLLATLDQMRCRGLVATRELLERFDLGFLLGGPSSSTGLSELEVRVVNRIVDVRIVESGKDARGRRDGSLVWTVLHQDLDFEPSSEEGNDDAGASWDSDDDHTAKASALLNSVPTKEHPPLLLLRTSGTTAEGKVVPLTGPQLLHNARRQVEAMGLTREDVTLNAMPLFHIGGLSCAFFSVLASGG
eukprot:CAMPEP_0183737196 /NCGR_PEP_ID=MMETSP0737-20130205/51290_1 /TAXON_ID=385413 /ORGANISM="Thalassiosira miniscula, Strain CCMP1093" /LENGTH=332 /DNA_ID=CAMNT_0025971423 /DNA_START=286 /DNA_END=1281 /DNA_ORIENTATION=+